MRTITRTCHYCHNTDPQVAAATRRPALLGGGDVDAHPGCADYATVVATSGTTRAVAKALAYVPAVA